MPSGHQSLICWYLTHLKFLGKLIAAVIFIKPIITILHLLQYLTVVVTIHYHHPSPPTHHPPPPITTYHPLPTTHHHPGKECWGVASLLQVSSNTTITTTTQHNVHYQELFMEAEKLVEKSETVQDFWSNRIGEHNEWVKLWRNYWKYSEWSNWSKISISYSLNTSILPLHYVGDNLFRNIFNFLLWLPDCGTPGGLKRKALMKLREKRKYEGNEMVEE